MRTGSLNVRRRRRAKVAVLTAGLALGACLLSGMALPVRAADLPDSAEARGILQVALEGAMSRCCNLAPNGA